MTDRTSKTVTRHRDVAFEDGWGFKEDPSGEWVRYDDIKHLLHPETTAPQSEVSADVSELKRLAGHYGGYAEKIMRAAATEIEQRRVEVEKYKAWAASCDPCFEYPPDTKPSSVKSEARNEQNTVPAVPGANSELPNPLVGSAAGAVPKETK